MKEGGSYVECACSHLSVYAAHAEFVALASYNEAFFASGFICISGMKDCFFISLSVKDKSNILLLKPSIQVLVWSLICHIAPYGYLNKLL